MVTPFQRKDGDDYVFGMAGNDGYRWDDGNDVIYGRVMADDTHRRRPRQALFTAAPGNDKITGRFGSGLRSGLAAVAGDKALSRKRAMIPFTAARVMTVLGRR